MELFLVSLLVADYDEAIDFFVNKVGFELIEDSPAETNDGAPKRWVVVAPPRSATGSGAANGGGARILLAQAQGAEQEARIGDQHGGRVGFFLSVDDFQAQYDRMLAAGVEFKEAPRTEPYGRVVVWRDIAGNLWDLLGP